MALWTLALNYSEATLETVGGKGLSLVKMVNAGLPVPGGFLVTTEAYRCFVDENGLQPRILEALQGVSATDPEGLEAASRQIGELFLGAAIPTEIAVAISGAYAGLEEAPVAVRSSATAEDLPGASFAGQQETYLNIRGADAVIQAVRRCWASLWTGRAIAYRMQNEIDPESVALAVVVQELVPADAAGILFTVNPTNGDRKEMLINAAWGLGEAVVSGAVTPDLVTVNKQTGRMARRTTAEKRVMTVLTESGTREQPVPESLQKRAVLGAAQVRDLARLGIQIEAYYQMPMDVEWALADGKFYILQARPVTALPLSWERPDEKAVYARGSLAEHLFSPVTPLFATLGLELANQATTELWDRVIGEKAYLLVGSDGFYRPINGYVYGGMYMDLKSMAVVTKMSFSQIGPMFRKSVPRWQAARRKLASVVDTWSPRQVESMSPSVILEGVRAVFLAACRYFTDIQTTLPAASSSEVVFTRFYNSLVRRKGDPEASVFLLGFDTQALRADKSLIDLAVWAGENPQLKQFILDTSSQELADLIRQEAPPPDISPDLWDEWRRRFQGHLEEFGRTAFEFDFANPTPAETPEPIFEALRTFLEGKSANPYLRQQEAVQRREAATREVLGRLGWPRRELFEKLLHWAQETSPMREDSIFDMGMGHPLIRRMLGELGSRFAAAGAIQQAEDIYWLEKNEVEELAARLEKGLDLPDLSERLPERKSQWQAYRQAMPPVILPQKSGWSKLIHGGEAVSQDGKTVLRGVGTSAGAVTAPARVLFGPEDFNQFMPGDVLVAVNTTPAWTPLFANAAAVVTDIGGPLSHSSIVAREYGIPAVMGARNATHLIRSGQMVTVDGSAGTVTLDQ